MDQRSSWGMCELYKEIRKSTGIADLTPLMCRTTFATLFSSDPRDIMDVLGHSTVDLTMEVYRKPITARQMAAVEELEGRLRGKVIVMRPRKRPVNAGILPLLSNRPNENKGIGGFAS